MMIRQREVAKLVELPSFGWSLAVKVTLCSVFLFLGVSSILVILDIFILFLLLLNLSVFVHVMFHPISDVRVS